MTDAEAWPGGMICAVCRVITVRSGDGWIHPAPLAEKFATTGVCDSPLPGREPKPRELRFGRGGEGHRDKHMVLGRCAPVDNSGVVSIAADGSYRLLVSPRVRKLVSWGFVSTAGRYGLGSSAPSGSVVGDDRPLVAELRGIFWGIRSSHPDERIELLVDSLDAIELIAAWRRGADTVPPGYSTGPRANGTRPLLLQLADMIRARGSLVTMRWVRGHSGVPLHEGADALSKIARAWGEGRLNKETVRSDALAAATRSLRQHAFSPQG